MSRQSSAPGRSSGGTEISFALLRIAVSTLLLWGALTKLGSGERMAELARMWAAAGVPQPQLLVTVSIALQLVLAALLLVGLYARMAGLLVALNFAVAAAASGILGGANWWAFALLIGLLLHFGMRGGGALSIDALRWRRLAAAAPLHARRVDDLLASTGIEPQADDSNNPGPGSA